MARTPRPDVVRRDVQLALPFVRGSSPGDVQTPGRRRPPPRQPRGPEMREVERVGTVRLVRHRGARRYVLRLGSDGTARLTIPRGGSERQALDFLKKNAGWLERQRMRHKAAADRVADAWRLGASLFLRGERVGIAQGSANGTIALGGERVPFAEGVSIRAAVTRHLREIAVVELPDRVRALAVTAGVPVTRVVVRDQKSRWGSCSPSATISLNWRLVQMPREVADYVILHELMHLEQANHSPKFWRLVRRACPWMDEARAWLRRHGRELL